MTRLWLSGDDTVNRFKDLWCLDQLEGYVEGRHDNLYERIEQTVYTDEEGRINAYVYTASNANLLKKKIPNGDWMEHKISHKQNKSITGGN